MAYPEEGSVENSLLFWSVLVGFIMRFVIMSVNVKGSWRMFTLLMSLSPSCYDLFFVMFQLTTFFNM